MGTLNVTGLGNHVCTMDAFGADELDLLCVTETWSAGTELVQVHSTTDIELSAWHTPASAHARRHHTGHLTRGGVRLLSRPDLPLTYKAHLHTEKVQLLVACAPRGLLVVGAYVSPATTVAEFNTALAWTRQHVRGNSIVLGDLNSRHNSWDPRTSRNSTRHVATQRGTVLSRWARHNSLSVTSASTPTFRSHSGSSNVDVVILRNYSVQHCTVQPPPPSTKTKHLLLFCSLSRAESPLVLRIPTAFWRNEEAVSAVRDSYVADLPAVTQAANSAVTASAVDAVATQLQDVLLRPFLRFQRRRPPRFRHGWTVEMDRLAKERSRLLRRASRGDAAALPAARTIDRKIQKLHKDRVRILEQRAAEQSQLEDADDSTVDREVQLLLESQAARSGPPPAEYLAHLNSVFPTETPLRPKKFAALPTFATDVEAAINKMKAGSSGGPDEIIPRCLKVAPAEVATSIHAVWTACGRVGHVPPSLLAGRVTPVFKKGDRTDVTNYRPITVLNVVRRAVSTALDISLRRILHLHSRQWGFRLKTGVHHALSHAEACARRGLRHRAVLDMKSAYDCAPRRRILDLMRARGVNPDLLAMVQCLLLPGSIYASGDPTAHMAVTGGVPQGDPLSPLLFNVLMDDLLRTADRELEGEDALSCYADDVLALASNRAELQRLLNLLSRWASTNGMRWNVAKSAELVVDPSDAPPPLLLAGHPLPVSEHASYLGVDIDANGVTSAGLLKRIVAARARLQRIAHTDRLISLSFKQRRRVLLTHVLSLSDFALPLQPLTPDVEASAAALDKTANAWVLRTAIPTTRQLLVARSLCRIPTIRTRRKLRSMRMVHGAMRALPSAPPDSHLASRSRAILSCGTLLAAAGSVPPHTAPLTPTICAVQREEWRLGAQGARPIPIKPRSLPAMRTATAAVQRVIVKFYLNRLLPTHWRAQTEAEKTDSRRHLLADSLTDAELNTLHNNLRKIIATNPTAATSTVASRQSG